MLRPIQVLLSVLVTLLLAGCLGGEQVDEGRDRPGPRAEGLPDERRLGELGLVIGPAANLIAACKRVARRTALTVYCPPVVPRGPVQIAKQRKENAYAFGEERLYGLSLQSDSLIDRERERRYERGGPPVTFPNRPGYGDHVWNPLAASHWVAAARTATEGAAETVDESAAYPRARFKSSPQRFTVDGVEATLVTGDVAGTGIAGSGHAIVYWQIDDVFYEASVHFDDKARAAKAIARGLIVQMVECGSGRTSGDFELCEWVFEGSQ